MARNCEKKLATLNRYVLAKEKDGKSANGVSFKKSRPPLKSLKTADDLKKWMPSITKEIDYCLSQIECSVRRNYADKMVEEFESRIEELQKEYKSFTRKVHELDPSTKGVPWTDREYAPRRSNQLRVVNDSHTLPLTSALLEKKKRDRVTETDDDSVSHLTYGHTSMGSSSTEQFGSECGLIKKNSSQVKCPADLLGLDYSSSETEDDD
jgi:hypothetical protein